MFSGLSKLADKPFVLGFFLPSLLGLIGFMFANCDMPLFSRWLDAVENGEAGFGDVLAALFVIWLIAIFLMALNDSTYRLLEGYFGPFNNRFCKRMQIRRSRKIRKPFNEACKQFNRIDTKIRRLTNVGPPRRQLSEAIREYYVQRDKLRVRVNDLLEKSNRHYFDYENEEMILGTRLGNVIRCFEMYPHRMYGASAIVMWPRILDVVSKEYKEILAEARASVDMFLNLYVISIFTGTASILRGSMQFLDAHHRWDPSLAKFPMTAAIAFIASWFFYLLATQSALRWWGETFRSAYDLYLGDLAKKLGFVVPDTEDKQRQFWLLWSQQFRYHFAQDFSRFQRIKVAGSRVRSEGGESKELGGEEDDAENDDEGREEEGAAD